LESFLLLTIVYNAGSTVNDTGSGHYSKVDFKSLAVTQADISELNITKGMTLTISEESCSKPMR
jgi:hypothetical protein